MTERRAGAETDPCGMTTKKARAKARAKEEADSSKE
jgi:hypothetical protein